MANICTDRAVFKALEEFPPEDVFLCKCPNCDAAIYHRDNDAFACPCCHTLLNSIFRHELGERHGPCVVFDESCTYAEWLQQHA